MVSLVRLLVTLSPARLAQLAKRWGVAAPPVDSLVARLYHEMTEDWSVKRILEHVSGAHRIVLHQVVDQPKGWAAGSELLRALPFSQETLEELLLELREWGLVAISSLDSLNLAAGPQARGFSGQPHFGPRGDWSRRWTCWVPADLAQVIRRVREQAAGEDRSHESLRRTLGALDLPSLQRLALHWHLPRAEHNFKRELVRALEGRLSQRESVARALAGVDDTARHLFDAIHKAGGRLSFARAQGQLGLQDDALHSAFDSLHELFLVHETYVGAERTLYIPAEASQADRRAAPEEIPGLAEFRPPPGVVPADDSLLNDLARLLAQARKGPLRHRHHSPTAGRPSYPYTTDTRRQIDATMADSMDSARSHYLIHACLTLGLLAPADGGLVAKPAVDAWARLDPENQLEALFRALLIEERWREPGPTGPRRAASPTALRRQVIEAVNQAEVGRWYAISSVARRVRARALADERLGLGGDPSLLPGSREVLAVFTTALHWVGVLTLGSNADGKPIAFQVTPYGRRLLDGVS